MQHNEKPVLKVANLSIAYGESQAISRLDFEIHKGEFVAILGPSGCGKSSMLNVISGLLEPTGGEVMVDDLPLYDPGRHTPKLGYVFQSHRLLPWRTVKQNLELALSASDVPREQWERNIDEMLDILHIGQFKDAWPLNLSGGQRQRVSIARAILVEPSYILMDEPLSTLDEVTARSLRQELAGISARTGTTIVFVTHSIREAVFLADRIIILTRGPSTIFQDYRVPLERPRAYDDLRIGEVERDIIERVQIPWGIHPPAGEVA
ncbi:ABC transporter ATP-binding protein [Vreelandella maris]|jgi:NitT/TauT family transport system ATP-binding protein|uniref:ABC transporter ATP-binding protein n=1 Tax=Vreelandella maris TaxID=2729617 RepID=UPI0030EE4746